MNQYLIVKQEFKTPLELHQYSKSLTAINRQLKRSMKYSGLDSSIQVVTMQYGSYELGLLVKWGLDLCKTHFEQYGGQFMNNMVKAMLTMAYNPDFLLAKQDCKDFQNMAHTVEKAQAPLVFYNHGTINGNVIIDKSNELFRISPEDAPLIVEGAKKRFKLFNDTTYSHHEQVLFRFRLLDVAEDPEGEDRGVIDSISDKSIETAWANKPLKLAAKQRFKEMEDRPISVSATVFRRSNGELSHYYVTQIHEV